MFKKSSAVSSDFISDNITTDLGALSDIIKFLPAFAGLIDDKQNIIAVSSGLLDFLGYKNDELVGKNFSVFLPDDFHNTLPELLREEKKYQGISIETYGIKKNGEKFFAKATSKLFIHNNSPLRWFVVDIIEPENSPNEHETSLDFKELSEMIGVFDEQEMVVETDINGNVKWANNESIIKTGYTKKDFDLGLNIIEKVIPENRVKFAESIKNVINGKHSEISEFTILKKNSMPMPAMVSFKLSGAKSKRIRIIAFDLSEHKRVENNLLILEKLRALGETAGGVIHDFNNVLSIILGYTQLIPGDCPNTFCKGIIENINKAAHDGVEMVKRISSFSDSADNKKVLEQVDINSIVSETIEMLSNKINDYEKEHNIVINVKKELNNCTKVLANESEMREVFSNLIINARDSISSDGTITVSTVQLDNNVMVKVSDTGCGMDEETKSRVLEPFFTTKGSSGTGLGMSVSFAIVDKYGGTIEIESELGKGSSFTVILPAAECLLDPPAQISSTSLWEINDPAVLNNSNPVMIVDDEENIRDILREFLKLEGYEVVCYGDGEKAWKDFKNYNFKAVITDFNLPGISGWELTKRIKKDSPFLPVFILSGLGSRVEDLNMKEKLAEKILQKPINFSNLSMLLKNIYDK